MIDEVKMHFQSLKAAFAAQVAYRWNFIISNIIILLSVFLGPLLTLLIYKNGASFVGWGMYEVFLLQGIFLMSTGVAYSFFFGIIWNTTGSVRDGNFDQFLLKPRPLLSIVMATGYGGIDIGNLLAGIILFVIALYNLPKIEAYQWILFILLFVVSLTVLFSFAVILASLGIVWIGNSRLFEIFTGISQFGLYPASIFSKAIKFTISFIVPIAMVGFVPATVLLSKEFSGILPGVLCSVLFLIAAIFLWRIMVKRYTSAGG